jgi:hypothetical protein
VEAAVLRYRVMAYVTGVVLMVLCFVGIPLQVAGHPAVANDVGARACSFGRRRSHRRPAPCSTWAAAGGRSR